MNTAVTSLPLGSAAPGSASAGSASGHWLARAGAWVWQALEEMGRARAQLQLRDFADRCDALQPELAKELRAASRYNPLV